MSFELTGTQKQSLRKQQKQTKDKREYIKLSIVLFLNAKVSMTLIAEGLGIDILKIYNNLEFTKNGIHRCDD